MYLILGLNIISFWILQHPLTALFVFQFGEVSIDIGISSILSNVFAFIYYNYDGRRRKQLFGESG